MNMKRILLLLIAIIGFNVNGWSQDPDYTELIFKSKIRDYKKKKPALEKLKLSKGDVKQIVILLGNSFYDENQIEDITEKVWLAFSDPKKFDYVYKDLAVRTIHNWNKKNFKGQIVVEPNPFLAEWTLANEEVPYFQTAIRMVLSYYKLMAYSEDAKNTKKNLRKLLYTRKMNFRAIASSDWTNYYLQSANNSIKNKGIVALIAANGQYDFFVCNIDKKEELKTLFKKINWEFVLP